MPNYSFTVTFVDIGGKPSTAQFNLFNAPSQASAETAIQTLVELLQEDPTLPALPLTLGAVTGVKITSPLNIGSWAIRNTPLPESENQKGGRFHFSTVGGHKGYVTIPTFNEALKLASGFLDMENDQIDALELALIASNWADSRFEDINGIIKGVFTYSGVPATE